MKKINLFLVDDHQIMLDGLQAFLEKEPQIKIVGTARSGEETLQKLETQPADVVVMDISMPPGMDGIETAKLIKRRYTKTKIILLTMIGESRFILNALRVGIHGYVIKEKSKESLMAAIHAVLNGNRYFPPDLLNRLDEEEETEEEEETINLTTREKEIICLMAKQPNLTAEQVAEQLFIATVTVQTHIRNAKDKLGMHRIAELVLYAKEKNLCK